MKIELGNIKRNSKTTLDVEVKINNKVVGVHRYNKDWHSHSFTEDETMESNDMLAMFQVTKELVNNLRRRI